MHFLFLLHLFCLPVSRYVSTVEGLTGPLFGLTCSLCAVAGPHISLFVRSLLSDCVVEMSKTNISYGAVQNSKSRIIHLGRASRVSGSVH